MAVFFLLVGLEIKREALEGPLSSAKQAALPVIAAFGGFASHGVAGGNRGALPAQEPT
jgi:NhaA family Na+:H+ antiporter